MDLAEITGRECGRWVVVAACGRRYFLGDRQIVCRQGGPRVGLSGTIEYVQGPASLVLTFIAMEGTEGR